jgi:hypothetical protein
MSVTFAQFRYFFLIDSGTAQLIHSPLPAVEATGRGVDPQICPSPSGEGHRSPAPVETADWNPYLCRGYASDPQVKVGRPGVDASKRG